MAKQIEVPATKSHKVSSVMKIHMEEENWDLQCIHLYGGAYVCPQN